MTRPRRRSRARSRSCRRTRRRGALARAAVLAVLVATMLLGRPHPLAADTVPVGVWPLQPQPSVVHLFDPPDSPYGSGHRGVDLAGHAGQLVHAALPGRVSFAGNVAGKPVVVVDHGPTRTTYEPVSSLVSVGQPVAAGAPIGRLVVPGSHCFPAACLHWGWIRGESTYLDPLLLVGGGPVRLLPPDGSAPQRVQRPAGPALPYGVWRPPLRLLL